ILWLIVNG
ncbi:hypothetical protein VCNEP21113_003011B, partial [Vibrio cholerae O1 str. Nep-21113]